MLCVVCCLIARDGQMGEETDKWVAGQGKRGLRGEGRKVRRDGGCLSGRNMLISC